MPRTETETEIGSAFLVDPKGLKPEVIPVLYTKSCSSIWTFPRVPPVTRLNGCLTARLKRPVWTTRKY
jgi:hypothetical protein